MSRHYYNGSPLHLTWCKNCQRAESEAKDVLSQLALERAQARLRRAADAIAADPAVWRLMEQDVSDSDCLRIAELFVTGGDYEPTQQAHMAGSETDQP